MAADGTTSGDEKAKTPGFAFGSGLASGLAITATTAKIAKIAKIAI